MTPLRTIALVAHVDHGKTTLVDAMLRQTGAVAAHKVMPDRVMDSSDLEREKGITILAKAASVTWRGTRINLVDTPGHSDFGGEVERALAMVDGVLLLVDAAEGPLPQTRYVLSKTLHAGLPSVVVLNKVDRADARPAEVLDDIYQLYMDLDAPDHDIEFPVISCVARGGRAVAGIGMPADSDDLTVLFEAILATIPQPPGDPGAPLQAFVTNLDASDHLGRLGIGRVVEGTLRRGADVALCTADEGIQRRKVRALLAFHGLERVDVDDIAAGDLFLVGGIPEVEIGDTIADPDNPVAMPRLLVDEPVLRMTFGVNTSPLAGEGRYLTSRHLRARLERETRGNVSIKVTDTDSPDVLEVAGRGELQLAVLIETMRREGYELQVSRPEVITRIEAGRRLEPLERCVIDVPDDHVGTVTQAMAHRKGRVIDLRPGDTGRTIVTADAPIRGLLGFRTQLMTATRGTALLHQHSAGWIPWVGDLPSRTGGTIVADRTGVATGYALDQIQERGVLFIGPGEKVYEGMVVGEASRPQDLHVNVSREKQKTNMRTHAADEAIRLEPPLVHTVESAIEWVSGDDLVEVTPTSLRIRKRHLDAAARKRARSA